MCGIAGIYFSNSHYTENPVVIVRHMLEAIEYRGPDESGIYTDDDVALGNVRLSIVDIETGQQPFFSNDKNYWIVFNGEIFNYVEIKTELIGKGITFRTHSDTEVLLNAFIYFGPDCLHKLNGQFSFAIWNKEKGELFLARDRVGIRPLFYTKINDGYVFGSEIKALLQHPEVKAQIDLKSLMQVFTAWTTIAPRTVFKNIKELQPGNYMLISKGGIFIRQYWSLHFPYLSEQFFNGTFEDAKDHLQYLLKDSTRIRLRADVPVAAYLSGGIDSSSMVALIREIKPEILQTYSVCFEDAEFDEADYQKEVATFLGTKHNSFYCTREDIAKFFPEIIWHCEVPLLRTAPVPMFCLSRKVRENNMKVVITGEGADEILGGYDIFKEAIIRKFWSHAPDSKIRPLLFNKLYPYLTQFQGKNLSVLKLFYGYKLNEVESPFYSHLLRWHNTSLLLNYLSDDVRNSHNDFHITQEILPKLPEKFNKYDTLSKSQWLEITLFLSEYLLSSQGDRVAMANSVEGRYPFLDYRVIEFASTLPSKFKLAGLNEKYILKKLMSGKLPDSVLKRPKQAYRAPMTGGFLTNHGQQYIPSLLDKRGILETEIFEYNSVRRLFEKIQKADYVSEVENMALSAIISTQILIHQFILKDAFIPSKRNLKNCKIYQNGEIR